MYYFKKIGLALLATATFNSQAQELVPNNSFENFTSLPDSWGQWELCVGWTNAGGEPEGGYFADPEYFHMDGSGAADLPTVPPATVNPHTADGIMAFLGYHDPSVGATNIREYLSVELTEPMVVGNVYSISFWLTNGESGIGHFYKCDGIGVLLSTSALNQVGTSYINRPPQVEIEGEVFSNEWVEYTFEFEADSAYSQLTIGNFYSDEETSASVAIEGPLPFAGAYYFVDDFSVTPIGFGNVNDKAEEVEIQFYPNPATDQVQLALPNDLDANYVIYNLAGEAVLNNQFNTSTTIALDQLSAGTYWVHVDQGEQTWKEKLVIQ